MFLQEKQSMGMEAFTIFLLCAAVFVGRSQARRQMTAFWGSEGGESEKSLKHYCDMDVYDIILIEHLAQNADGLNIGPSGSENLPKLLFSNKCNDNTLAKQFYPSYLKCPTMERDIRYCQGKGIKVLLSVGKVSYVGFDSRAHAKQQALFWWNLFLGGTYTTRTFGSVKLDGINLNLNHGSRQDYMIDFVKEMRRIIDTKNTTKEYLLTASPRCSELMPNLIAAFMRPSIENSPKSFDYLMIDFSDSTCNLNTVEAFERHFKMFNNLSKVNEPPKLFVQLDARQTSTNFVQPKGIQAVVNSVLENYPKFAGFVVNQAGFDSIKPISRRYYSQHLRSILDDKNYDIDKTTTTTTTTTTTKSPATNKNKKNKFNRYNACESRKASLSVILVVLLMSLSSFFIRL